MRKFLFYLMVVFLVVSGTAVVILNTDVFWRWAGYRLIALGNDQLQGELRVQDIQGTPFRGYVFHGVELNTPQGEVFRAKGLSLRLSFGSILRLAPVFETLALYEPFLTLEQDEQGRWNVSHLLQPSEEPAPSVPIPLRSLTLSQVIINNGRVVIKQPGSSHLIEDLEARLNLTLPRPLDPPLHLELGPSRLAAATPWGPYSLDSQLTLQGQQLNLAAFTLTTDGQPLLSLTGDVSLDETGASTLKGVIGPVPPDFMARFYPGWPTDWKTAGKLRLQGNLADLRVSLEGTVQQAALTINGSLGFAAGKDSYDVKIVLARVSPEMLSALNIPGGEIYGRATPLSVRLHLQGSGLSWPPRQFSWHLQAEPLTLGTARVEQLDLKAAGTAHRQTLEGVLAGDFGRLSVTSQGSFFTAPRGGIELRTENFEPGRLGLDLPPDTVLTGSFVGAFSLPDLAEPERLRLGGEVQAYGYVAGYSLGDLRGSFAWQQPRLTLERVQGELGNVALQLHGTLDGDRLNFSFTGHNLAGCDWPIPKTVQGTVTWSGTVQGTLSEPRYTLQAQARGLAVDTVEIPAAELRVQGQGLPPHTGALTATAAMMQTPAGTIRQVNLAIDGARNLWRYNLKASSPAPGPLAELRGSLDLGPRPVSLLVDRLHLRIYDLNLKNRTPVQARFLPGVDLPTAALELNGATVQVAARLQGDEVAASLEVRQLPLALANIKGLKGMAQAQATVSGFIHTPQVEARISLAPLTYKAFSLEAIDTTLRYREETLQVTGQATEKPEGLRLLWDGSLPLALSLAPFHFSLPDADLNARIRTEGANLGLLAEFSEEISKADCPLDFQARIAGAWSRPEIEADLRWQQGYITLSQAGIPFAITPGNLSWQRNRVSLPQLTLVSGGTAIFSGQVELTGYEPQKITARADLNNFKILDRLMSEAFINGGATLQGPLSGLDLRGQFSIPRAIINPALIRPTTRQHPDIILVRQKVTDTSKKVQPSDPVPGPFDLMNLAVTLQAPNNIFVRDQKTSVELSLSLFVKKPPREPLALAGVVQSLEGQIDVLGKEFKLVRGIVTLPGVAHQEPFVEARATHDMTDATLTVDVSGPINKPHIALSSTPPLAPNDLLSYLIFGRPTSALSQEEFNAQQQAVGVLGGITATKIQELLGEDFPILGNVAVRSTPGSIGLVKPLAKGLNITVEQRISPKAREDPAQVRLEYRINRNFRLQAEQGQRNTGADALFRYDF